ncbi:Gfo/Idh/MocA family protein [Aquisphaera insulae]|uniref:Gfo/Idh/MocA family protein n=1 Tax=Aquisphaera insulae TaxID=2712864 RepID=UPI0013EC7068|nr:Gfo/Idh/MocA family oxidoreductase [Aquisphaera insulae]
MSPSNSRSRGESTRRAFVKETATATAAAGIAGVMAAGGVHAAGSDVIRVGIVGCGGRGTGAAGDAMAADPGVRVVAIGDLFRDRVESSRSLLRSDKPEQVQVDDAHCFVGLDAYRKVIDSVDYVIIACAAKFHAMYLKAGIEAGKHVFVEKPHAIDPLGVQVVRQATALAKQKNVGILSGLMSRFWPMIGETVRRVQDGQIGEIVSIEENFIRGPYGQIAHPKGLREIEAQYANQYRFSWLCGDDVVQSLVHNLDRATWALKETPPVKCHGLAGRSGPQDLLGDVFDHHSVVYHYANGVKLYAFCRTTNNCYNEDSSLIHGTKGVASLKSGVITGQKPWRYSGPNVSPYVIEHAEFIKSIRAGRPLNCGDYAARSTLVAIMGQLSCYSGQEVTWDDVSRSEYFYAPRPEACTWEMAPPTRPDAKGVYPVCAVPGTTRNI